MPLLFILGAFVTGAFVAHGAHAALRQEDIHKDLKNHLSKLHQELKEHLVK